MLKLKHIDFNSSSIDILREYELSDNLHWVHYRNGYDRLRYCNTNKHTLSMYFKGGHSTHRTDLNTGFGAPGKFCLMPDSAESHWQLGEPQEFVHLYFGDDYLKRIALESLNLDPRIIELPELNFHSSAKLQALYNYQIKLMDWTDDECISIQQHTDTILITLLTSLNLRLKKQSVKGGLPPRKIALIHDYVCSHYGSKILLSNLAGLVELSEFHFCRVFKESTTYTPQEYVTKIRLKYAKEKLSSNNNSLIDVAFSCGFNSQSHFGRQFVKAFGVSPAKYRKAVHNI